ncbi:hypothetical protein BAUCODRAFT_67201 [Baudoinia panamericana UAMH 10762]|uniref:Micro-fibrillar-associated protein 1 C-terminal domain-containing protein n=1 Tax=Baudoinia panamericana (strain UAMH 10762) TaxID=717646 RepID=M2NGI4_BAUPA|nr:uncharacterized protein BAUCODRAFT_67201 [Baudoinia panamericana UAMH 10762]EMC98105.1 hypothetical protein BAUCODRAFT_67201 [Baudoinia panamericana UAMH 10762]
MTKNRQQPSRYFPGKAEQAEGIDSDEESEAEDDGESVEPAPRVPAPKATTFPSQQRPRVPQSVRPPPDKPEEPDLDGFVTASETSEDEEGDGSDGEGKDESEASEDSSDEEPKKPMLRPTFLSKAQRAPKASTASSNGVEDMAAEQERQRKAKADEMLQAQLERDAAARAVGRKAWDDDADNVDPEDVVDDTDGVDVDAEHAAWKLRELKRVRRDRLAIEDKEKEREEVERRRNMTAEEREAEDKAYLDAQKEDREGKGKMAFMQKYHHKGAFFGDDVEDEEVQKVLNRDLAGARFADETGDKAVLPEYMRIRDMTRLGKKGRTRYKDLKTEDTGRWGTENGRKWRDSHGLDDRFKPDDRYEGGPQSTGANNAPVGERRRVDGDPSTGRQGKRMRYE